MAIVEIRQRTGSLLAAVVLAQIILISAQIQSKSGIPVLEAVTFGMFAELQRSASAGVSSISTVWTHYVALRHVKSENDALEREIADLQVDVQQQRALAEQSRGLQRLLDLRQQTNLTTVAANVIGAGATPDFRTATLDKGTFDGLHTDMAVVSPDGVVGRIVVPSFRAAKVQLLIDRNAAAGGLVQRSRAQGIIEGAGDEYLRLDYVPETADLAIGDIVVSSGIDGIYPKGFVIGRVESIEKNGTAYNKILVKPGVDFSRLEQVLVVLTPTPAREAAQEQGPEEQAPPAAGGHPQ